MVKQVFGVSFTGGTPEEPIGEISQHLTVIDEAIAKAAPEWPIDKIAKIDLAVLRVSVWELMIARREPPKVVIDEAVEIAKEYGNEKSPKFINGVLGTILKTL
jgi:N utilization substance protein B